MEMEQIIIVLLILTFSTFFIGFICINKAIKDSEKNKWKPKSIYVELLQFIIDKKLLKGDYKNYEDCAKDLLKELKILHDCDN